MLSFNKQDGVATPFPVVPSSLRTEPFDLSSLKDKVQRRADTSPYITPYLSLRSRLSQIWINRWTVLLVLILVRLLLLVAQLNDNTGDAKAKALSACTKVEDIGSSMASMPHYLSLGVNEMAATGIEKAVRAMVNVLDLMLLGVEGIIIFFINFLTATYTCLVTALVHGSLDVVANVTEGITDGLNDLIDKVAKEIDDISGDLEGGINKLTDSIENSIIGGLIPDIPKVDFSEPIDSLKNFNISSDDFVKDVRQLNDDLPDFEQVQNMTKQAISVPFNLVRGLLNDTYGTYSFDKNAFPLAQKQQLTFCSDNDDINTFFQHLYDMIEKARVGFMATLITLAILAMIPMAWLEIKRWRRQQSHAKLVSQNQYDPMDVVYIATRPVTASFGIKVASRFKGNRQVMVRWCVAYATSPAALFVLSLALAGFFSCFCQFILLKGVQNQVPELSDQVGDFAGDVVKTLQGVSEQWAGDANGVIGSTNDDINKNVLEYVTNATSAVNDTLTTFLDVMEDGLEAAFNGTILLDPIKTVLHCVIGIKIESVQKGLTWVHDNAHIQLPLFDNNTFSLGASDSISGDSKLNTFLASPSSVTTDEVTGAVEHVVDWLHSNMVQEAFISVGIILVYVIVVLFGVMRTLAGMATSDRGRAGGGMRYVNHELEASHRGDESCAEIELRSVPTQANPFADPVREKTEVTAARAQLGRSADNRSRGYYNPDRKA